MGSTKSPKYTPPPAPMITRMPIEADFEKDAMEARKKNQKAKRPRQPLEYKDVVGQGKTLADVRGSGRGTTVFSMGNYQ